MKTLLEAVPPELHRGPAAVDAVVAHVAAVHADFPLDGVNIPEIHEEPSRSSKGERRKPFAPRIAPRELAYVIQEQVGVPCMINRVVVTTPADQLLDWANETWERYGINQFVLVGGGLSQQTYVGPSVMQANQLLREDAAIDSLRIGNICIPSRDEEIARLREKTLAGADFFTTQILYEAEDLQALLMGLDETPGAAPEDLWVALCPARTLRNIRFLLWLGVNIPDALEAWLIETPDEVQERSLAQIKRVWQSLKQDRPARTRPALGINLAPIGAIPTDVTVALAKELAAI
ncbi:MAG: methylenetetrahydrofolate reductase [Gammaproteobacteria bacterium]|nr:methylenetetrahydrofolate reductase [Gammaproteobacteria bacterium]